MRSLEAQHVGSQPALTRKLVKQARHRGRAAKTCKETARVLGAGGAISCHGRELVFSLAHKP